MTALQQQFGDIDMRVLDAGCGGGRNLPYLLRHGYEVCAVDQDESAMETVWSLAAKLAPELSAANFRVARIEAMPFPDGWADAAISSAVLHFARDDAHFNAMLQGTWRVLKTGGLLFCRLASSIGIEAKIRRISGRRYALPDGSERYLVDEELMLQLTEQLGGRLADPLKTTVVQNQRAMTTWVLWKN